MSVQYIELNGTPTLVVLPIDEWQALQERMEDLEDIAEASAALHEESFPAEFVDRLLAGESPVRVWRSHRGLTRQALAEHTSLSEAQIEAMEDGTFTLDQHAELCHRLCAVLKCDPEDLVQQ